MTPERWRQVDRLLEAALEVEPHRRTAFLAEACAGDDALRHEVEALLAVQSRAAGFLEAGLAETVVDLPASRTEGSAEGQCIGPYRVLARIGRGAMGEVYLARDTRLGRRVALKLLPEEFTRDETRVRRFQQEARAASALNHPNILTVYDVGQAEGTHFIVTEYIEGETLRQRMAGAKMALPEVLAVAVQVAGALQAAHRAGIAHRDIKPENIMLRPDGYVKVLDFGIAKLLEKNRRVGDSEALTLSPVETASGQMLGTPTYMSPEQARGLAVDERTDIFSLGVVMYEMLAGRAPFAGETFSDVILSILDKEPEPLAQAAPQVPLKLERIVGKMLRKDREARYQTMSDLLSDLRSLQQEVDSRPVGRWRRLASRPIWLATTLALALAVVAWRLSWPTTSESTSPPAPGQELSAPAPAQRLLTYSVTVQKFRDGRPYGRPFLLAGEINFEPDYRIRLHLTSPQAGYLYILNEGPEPVNGRPDYNVLFPSVTANGGLALLAAHQPVQVPGQSWFAFDQQEGTEKIWLVWSARSVPELEAVKGLANPTDKGALREPGQIRAVQEFLTTHSATKPVVEKDEVNRRTDVSSKEDILVHLVKLEHH